MNEELPTKKTLLADGETQPDPKNLCREEKIVESDADDQIDEKDRPSLKNLVVPWLSLALVAVALTAHQALVLKNGNEDDLGFTHHVTKDARSLLPSISSSHKSLYPLSNTDIIGFACAIVGLIIAGGGGIGGGGILVPIYILILGFSPKHAIPLANVTVFGGSVANTILNTQKRHPLADRPLVDWDLILVMEPLTIAGALIGAFLNKLLPEGLLVVMLVLLLSFTAHNTLTKAMKMYKKESKEIARQKAAVEGSALTEMVRLESQENVEESTEELLESMELGEDETAPGPADTDSEQHEMKYGNTTVEQMETLKRILDEERSTPMNNIMILVSMFVVVLFVNIVKGGGAFPSPLGIKCGSSSFWIANFAILAWIVVISLFVRSYLVNRFETKERVNYPYVEGDIKWDGSATIKYPVICALAGFFAGMFGVGGGIVKGPLMLAMGIHPAVSSASSACMILFTSFTATTSFVVFGLLDPDYAPFCLAMGFVATFGGQLALHYLMQKFQRNSLIAFSIGFVVLLSAFLMTIQSLVSLAEGTKHHSGGVCGAGD